MIDEDDGAGRPAPGDLGGLRRHGADLAARGALEEARACFERVVDAVPGDRATLNNLAVVLHRLGHLNAAAEYYARIGAGPDVPPEIAVNHAALLGQIGRYREGLVVLERILPRRRADVTVQLLAADLERDLGRNAAALARIERLLHLAPDSIDIALRRANLLGRLGRWPESLQASERVLARDPDHAEALRSRALALQGLDRTPEALAGFEAAERASPAPAPIMADRARLLAETGDRDEAYRLLGEALTLSPGLATLWYNRAALMRYQSDDPDLAAMARCLERPDLPDRDRLQFCFALGKAWLDLGDGGRAFGLLDEANRLRRMSIDYAVEADASRFAEIAAVFSAGLMGRAASTTSAAEGAIFVFGMPRSGTTLVEQILSSHPRAQGIGESHHLAAIAEATGPARISDLDPAALSALGRDYENRIAPSLQAGRRSVDKMPGNFIHAGLIAMILPEARMIHCRRDPLDTCLSCYALLFTAGQEFTYDQTELGRFYRLYQGLMDHWHRVLPPDRLLDIDYEALVRNPEPEIRRILDFCGLEWDPACPRFHETRRRVTTASLDQVRRPLFTTSIGRAQGFRPWLGPLMMALAGG